MASTERLADDVVKPPAYRRKKPFGPNTHKSKSVPPVGRQGSDTVRVNGSTVYPHGPVPWPLFDAPNAERTWKNTPAEPMLRKSIDSVWLAICGCASACN